MGTELNAASAPAVRLGGLIDLGRKLWATFSSVLPQFSRGNRWLCRYCFLKPLLGCLIGMPVQRLIDTLRCGAHVGNTDSNMALYYSASFLLSLILFYPSPFLLLQNTQVELESLEARCPFKSPQVLAQQRAKHIPHSSLNSCATQIWGNSHIAVVE